MNKYELDFCNHIIERVNKKLFTIINKRFNNYNSKTKDEELIWEINRFDLSEFLFINDQINFANIQEELKKIGIDIKINKTICTISFIINMKNIYLDLINQSLLRNKLENIEYDEDRDYIDFWRKFDEYDKEYFDRLKH